MHLPAPPLLLLPLLLLLLWHSHHCASESTITHATNVSKRQLQYGDSFASPGYQMNAIHDNQQQTNAFMQSTRLLYDPGYNAQHNHEVASELASRSANSAIDAMMNSPNTPHQYQQRSQEARKFDNIANGFMGGHFEAPQTFSHIYFPHVYSPSSQHGPGRTAPHVFPGDTPATMAARNNGQSYSTSSTYFVPMSVLYHPNVGLQQQFIQPQRQVQQQQQQQHHQQQQMQAYNPLPPPLPPPPPPPAQFRQYAPQIAPPPPPPPPPPPSPPLSPHSHQQQHQSHEQQQSTSQQSVYQRHSQQPPSAQAALPPPLPPLPHLPHLPHGQQPPLPPPPPLNFQAPFRASQFLGYMNDGTRGGAPNMGGGADERGPLYTEAYAMTGAPPLQQSVGKPIYERMRENFMNDASQQNYQAPTSQHARYGRYIYMAPSNVYALFKSA